MIRRCCWHDLTKDIISTLKTDSTWLALASLQDNYIWAAAIDDQAYIVDPGQAHSCIEWLEREKLQLAAVLVTHRHADHVDGIAQLHANWPDAQIIAPSEYKGPQATRAALPGERIELAAGALTVSVIATPGHTRGHVSYLGIGFVLCGDALFACGCGRLFEGDGEDLLQSMEAFRAMPKETLVCCGHEYTLANIRFARAVEPENGLLEKFSLHANRQAAADKPTVPTTIEQELAINPFLRHDVPAVAESVCRHAGREISDPAEILLELRRWKDSF